MPKYNKIDINDTTAKDGANGLLWKKMTFPIIKRSEST
jgi:hypothetical protein